MSPSSKPAATDTTPAGRYHVTHYGKGRNFALYEGKNLLAVTVYKRGAEAVQRALEARDTVIAEQAPQIEQLIAAATSPEPEKPTPYAYALSGAGATRPNRATRILRQRTERALHRSTARLQ